MLHLQTLRKGSNSLWASMHAKILCDLSTTEARFFENQRLGGQLVSLECAVIGQLSQMGSREASLLDNANFVGNLKHWVLVHRVYFWKLEFGKAFVAFLIH